MAHRLQLVADSVKKQAKIVDSSFDFLDLGGFLTPEENGIRKAVRQFVDSEVTASIVPYVEQAKFPDYLLPKLQKLGIGKHFFKKPYGHGARTLLQGLLYAELARGDAGVATLCIVQFGLLGYTVETLASEEQKAKYLPKIMEMEWVGGWGLTEDKVGSDAANIQTTVSKEAEGYRINGVKRWIGNGNKDLLVVWAKNTESKNVEAYLLETKGLKGWSSEVIQNKLALRVVHNCHITLKDVVVGEGQKLPKAVNFQQGTNVILKHSRIFVCWIAAGICLGVYDNAIRYTTERKQFGRPIAGFQLVQQKLVRIMSNVQAVMLMCIRISNLVDEGRASLPQIAMTKAFVTERAREIARWGREVCGGNGLLHENYVMRAIADVEAVYTYEGSYEINTLVAGRELTGLAAFTK